MTLLRLPVPLDELRACMRDQPALPPLTAERYALTHARYEAASDQRSRLQDWMVAELPPLLTDRDPVRVVGVGVGDGSVDAPLATALVAGGRAVHYTGVEPHAPSAVQFAHRLNAIEAPGLTPTIVVGDFADQDVGHPADLLHFLHSLYYVADLAQALDHGLRMVRPGGLLVTATAPLEPLCVLTELLCPWGGRTPWFAQDVHAELDRRGVGVREETLVGHLDVRAALADPLGRGEAVLDFLIGARSCELTTHALQSLLDYLRDVSLPGRPGVLPHPLNITISRVP